MLRAATLALGDLADRHVLGVLVRSLSVTLLIFAGLGLLAAWALRGADPCGWLADGSCPLGLSAGGLGALVLVAIGSWLLFPAVALGVVAAYADRVAAAVEARHYPHALAGARPVGPGRGAVLGLRSSLRLLLYNLLALPLYLVLIVTGIGTLALFVGVNGIAIGRDLGELVAARHGDRASRRAWLRATRGRRALMGILVAGIFLLPVVNLLAPVLGAAMATHLYHARGDRDRTPWPSGPADRGHAVDE